MLLSPRRMLAALAFGAALWLGCSETETGLVPVGEVAESPVRLARFVRRLHLDLAGVEPSPDALAQAVAVLAERNDAKARGALAAELVARPSFAALFVAELENRVFAGQTTDAMYAFYCPILQSADPACAACAPTVDCGGCDCPLLASYGGELAGLHAAAADLAEGRATTSDVERRFVASLMFRIDAGSPESIADKVFQEALGRPAEADERHNGAFLATGTLIPGSPAGLLFQRTGETYADLVDIVFESEVYRDAAVTAVFRRYLGRDATGTERNVLSRTLEPTAPDVRGIVTAVVSSKEYFAQ
jgi:hypothetical protein